MKTLLNDILLQYYRKYSIVFNKQKSKLYVNSNVLQFLQLCHLNLIYWNILNCPMVIVVLFFKCNIVCLIFQLFDRIKLFWMPAKHQPDFIYLRHVPLRKVHLFTVIQMSCLGLLWIIKVSRAAIVFPMMVRNFPLPFLFHCFLGNS